MPTSIRLSEHEQLNILNKTLEMNQEFSKRGEMGIKESELVHIVLELATPLIRISRDGVVMIKE